MTLDTAVDFVHLGVLAGHDAHASADRGAIALGAEQFDLDPVLLVAAVVAQQAKANRSVQNHGIDVAVVIVVAEGRAAAGKALGDAGAHRG
jgi:hypothetical protein